MSSAKVAAILSWPQCVNIWLQTILTMFSHSHEIRERMEEFSKLMITECAEPIIILFTASGGDFTLYDQIIRTLLARYLLQSAWQGINSPPWCHRMSRDKKKDTWLEYIYRLHIYNHRPPWQHPEKFTFCLELVILLGMFWEIIFPGIISVIDLRFQNGNFQCDGPGQTSIYNTASSITCYIFTCMVLYKKVSNFLFGLGFLAQLVSKF